MRCGAILRRGGWVEEEDLGEVGEDSRAHAVLAGVGEPVPLAANEVLQQVEPKEPLCTWPGHTTPHHTTKGPP